MLKTLFIFSLLFITPSLAQHKHDPQSHAPYAGLEKREIKALSDEQIKDLKSGKGMTLALAAELNGYPGPAHVLELADKLNLTSKQKQQTQDLFKAMSKETKALGAQLIKEEKALDLLFKNKTTLIIAHRLSTAANADNIIVLDKGVIVEQGTHESLLLQKGKYYEMWEKQKPKSSL